MLSAAPLIGSFLGLMFSVVVIGGLAVLIHQAGVYYTLPKWAIEIVSSRLAH
jgi:hypothetical protein